MHLPLPPVFIHGVGVRWSAHGSHWLSLFLSCLSRTAYQHACAYMSFHARAAALVRTQEFDDGLIHHVRLTPARSPMDGLCLACRSSDAVQKVFIFPSWSQPPLPLNRMFAAGARKRQWSQSVSSPSRSFKNTAGTDASMSRAQTLDSLRAPTVPTLQ